MRNMALTVKGLGGKYRTRRRSCSRCVADCARVTLLTFSQPWYGQAIAQCLLSEYLLKYFPYEDFVIYEIGAGNGTLALDILDYIQDRYPEVYDRTQYKIIEISASLANLQREKLSSKHPCVKIHNQSIFRWSKREPAPCFFLAMEVIVSALPILRQSRQ